MSRQIAITIAALSLATSESRALQVEGDFPPYLRTIAQVSSPAEEYWNTHAVKITGKNCVALGRESFIVPKHVGVPRGATDVLQATNKFGKPCDLLLFRFKDEKFSSLPDLPIAERAPLEGERLFIATQDQVGSMRLRFLIEKPPFRAIGAPVPGIVMEHKIIDAHTIGYTKVEDGDSGAAVFQFDPFKNRQFNLTAVVVSKVHPLTATPEEVSRPSASATCVDLTSESGLGRTLSEYREGKLHGPLPSQSSSRLPGIAITLLGGLACCFLYARQSLQKRQLLSSVKNPEQMKLPE